MRSKAMRIEFNRPRSESMSNVLAEAEVVFGPEDAGGIFHGLKLVGFTVWNGERGRYVTLPARAFGVGHQRAYFDFLRPQDGPGTPAGKAAVLRLKRAITDAYDDWTKGPSPRASA
jgi:hypothetical protein